MRPSLEELSKKELLCLNSHSDAYKCPFPGTGCERGQHKGLLYMDLPCPRSLCLLAHEGSTPCLPKQDSPLLQDNLPLMSFPSLLTRPLRICSDLSPFDLVQTKYLHMIWHPTLVFCSSFSVSSFDSSPPQMLW